jgi:hypothetical protein
MSSLASRFWFLINSLQHDSRVHIPTNNCCFFKLKGLELSRVAEFTFLRNDKIKNKKILNTSPNPLDYNCDQDSNTGTSKGTVCIQRIKKQSFIFSKLI